MVPPKVTPSFQLFQLAALYFVINWANDQNNYIAAVMVVMVDTVLIDVAVKVAATKMPE
jgi:hypothetical protein